MESLYLIALMSISTSMETTSTVWQNEYARACEVSADEKKPVVLFIGTGEAGWKQIIQEGKVDSKIDSLLSKGYIPLYVDRSTSSGENLTKALEITKSQGLVVSDRGGNLQVFSHNGKISQADLIRVLERYQDNENLIQTTESLSTLNEIDLKNTSTMNSELGSTISGNTIFTSGCANGNCPQPYKVNYPTWTSMTTPTMTSCPNGNCGNMSPYYSQPTAQYPSHYRSYSIPSSCPNGNCPR